jgi:hypothetical protein
MSNPRSRTQEHEEQWYAAKSKSQDAQRDTRFVSKVQHNKCAYISIEESTKDQVSFNPRPLELPTKSTWFSTMNSHEEEDNINFPGLNHKPWELPDDI